MAGPPRAVAAARTALREALADCGPGTRVLVACSGGADSLALAVTTAFLAPRQGLVAGAVTVDHGLRPGARAEAEAVAQRCAALGLSPALVRSVDVTGAGGPEGAAREARYAALRAAAREVGGGRVVVLLGHTADDQAETVLLGLARGSGGRSLAGMPPRWTEGPCTFVRPFLSLRRSDTEAVCRAAGLAWVTDPTNAAAGPWRAADGSPLRRAAVRERVLPALVDALGPGVVPALVRTAEQLRRDEDHLDDAGRELLRRARAAAGTPAGDHVDVVDVATLATAHPAVRTRALRRAVLEAGATPGDLKAVHVAELDRLVTDHRGQGPVPVPGGLEVARRCGRLVVDRAARRSGSGQQRYG